MVLASPAVGEGDPGGGARKTCKRLSYSEADPAVGDCLRRALRVWRDSSNYCLGVPMGTIGYLDGRYVWTTVDANQVSCRIGEDGLLRFDECSFFYRRRCGWTFSSTLL